METLTPGVIGPEVTQLQNNLYLLRYEVYGTSVYDAHTIAAVQAFRSANWGDPGNEDCEPYTFGAIAMTAESVEASTRAPAEPQDSSTSSSGAEGAGSSPDGTTAVIVNSGGTVLAHVKPKAVHRQGAYTPSKDLGVTYDLLRETYPEVVHTVDELFNELSAAAAEIGGVTLAIGLDAEAAAMFGFSVGAGIYASSTGESGFYTSLGGDWGLVLEAAVGIGVTIMNGGPDAFGGAALAVKVSGDMGIGVAGALLYSPGADHLCIGACLEVSFGAGGGIYLSMANTWLKPIDD